MGPTVSMGPSETICSMQTQCDFLVREGSLLPRTRRKYHGKNKQQQFYTLQICAREHLFQIKMISPTPIGDPGPPGPAGTTTPGGAPPAATAALATTGSQETSSAQNSGSSSYVDKLKVNVNRFERLTRNVLEINLEKDSSVTFINLEAETVAKVLSNLGVDIQTQV